MFLTRSYIRIARTDYLGLKTLDVYLKKMILWMKTIHYPNKIRSLSVTMAPLTPISTSYLRSALHFRYSIVIPRCIPCANGLMLLISNNHYDHGFYNTFDDNHFICSDYLLCTVTTSAHIIC